eukprot:gene8567-17675_t
MAYNPDSGTATIFSTLLIYGVIGILLMLVFEYVRKQRVVFYPKCDSHKSRTPEVPPTSFLSWIPFILQISNDDTLKMIGMDGYVFLSYIRLCARISFLCGFIGCIILIPIYATTPFNHLNPGILRWTMGNIREAGDELWAPLIFYYIFVIVFLALIFEEYRYFALRRQRFLK